TDMESAHRESQLQRIRTALSSNRSRIAVVAHLYYLDLVPELLEHLDAINEDFDLYVTLPDWGARRIQDMVLSKYPSAVFYKALNRGRDIGPFVDLLPIILEKSYTALLKIQTKRGYYKSGR